MQEVDWTAHFKSYRASVLDNALEGYIDAANAYQTADPKWPSVADYLRFITEKIRQDLQLMDKDRYLDDITNHQEAMLALFMRMASETLEVRAKTEDRRIAVLDMAHHLGWNWFKFLDFVLEFDKFVVIPRYTDEHIEKYKGIPLVDADEMKMIFAHKPCHKFIEPLLERKAVKPAKATQFSPSGDFILHDAAIINPDGQVNDWTQELYL